MNQIEFDLGIPIIEKPTLPGAEEPNPMCRQVGYGPEEALCKTCKYLILKVVHSQAKFHKCEKQLKLQDGHYVGKDYRLKWRACGLYESKGEDNATNHTK